MVNYCGCVPPSPAPLATFYSTLNELKMFTSGEQRPTRCYSLTRTTVGSTPRTSFNPRQIIMQVLDGKKLSFGAVQNSKFMGASMRVGTWDVVR